MSTTLTRTAVNRALRDAAKGAPVTLRDSRVPGLSLAATATASRWRLDYKVALAGGGWSAGKRVALGDAAAMSLEDARRTALELRGLIASGIDPAAAKLARRRLNLVAGASQTVAMAVERFAAERSADWTTGTRRQYAGDLKLIIAEFGAAPMAMIERAALADFVGSFLAEQRKAGHDGLSRAVRLAQLLGAIWRQAGEGTRSRPGWGWPAIHAATAANLPVEGRYRIASRSRVLTDAEIRMVWPALMDRAGPRFLALALSLVTGLRTGAITLTRVSDLDLDPVRTVGARDFGPTIRIPAEDGRKATAAERRAGADMVLPLSALAVALFRRALAECSDGVNVFVSPLGGVQAQVAVSTGWAQLVEDGIAPVGTVAHDLRRTMRTGLGEIDHGGAYEDEERLVSATG